MAEIGTNQKNQFEQMTDEPIKKLLIKLSVPAILSMLVTNIYNIADTAFVGTLGTSQSGATGVVFSFMAILQSVAFMCGQGAGSIMSRRLGAKDAREATEYSSTGFFISFFLGAVLGGASFIFMKPLLYLLGSTDTIYPHAKVYISCIALVAPFFTSSLTMNNILRYEGKARLGTVGMISGAILNIGLDALLMLRFNMGILGAGIATAASQFISFCILFSMFILGRTKTKISPKYISRSIGVFFNICATGFPSLLRQGLTSVSGLMLNRCARVYGDAAVSAFSCVSRISFFAVAVAIGIGQGFQPISSFNFGAGRKERVRKAFWTAIVGEEIVIACLSLAMYIFSPELIQLLRDDPKVIGVGVRALRLMSISSLFLPMTMMVEMGFQSIGSRLLASFASSLRSGLLLIPSLLILSHTRGLPGIQEAQPVSIVLSFVIGIYLCKVYLDKLKE